MTMCLLCLSTTADVVKITCNTTNDDNLQHRGMLVIRVWHLYSQISECMFTIVKLLLCKGYHINKQCGHI